MKTFKQAFTLIEMLVVIAIIAILAAILVPTITGAMGKAKTLQNMSNVRSIGQAIQMYALDNKNRLPVRWWYSNRDRNGDIIDGMRQRHWQEQIVDYVGRDRDGSIYDYQKAEVFKSSSVTESFGNHFGLNKFMFESYPQWNYYLGVIPNPSGTVIVGEINKNSSYIDPEVTPAFDGNTETYYRISNHKQMGIYMFADFHVEQLKGDQGMSENPDIWKWW